MPKFNVKCEITRSVIRRTIEVEAPTAKEAKRDAYAQSCDEGIVKITDCKPVRLYCVEGRLLRPLGYTLYIEADSPAHAQHRLAHEFVTWEDVLRYAKDSGGGVDDECDSYDEDTRATTCEVVPDDEAEEVRKHYNLEIGY